MATSPSPPSHVVSPHNKLSFAQIATTRVLLHRKRVSRQARRCLWDEAFAQLNSNEAATLVAAKTQGQHVRPKELQCMVRGRLDDCQDKSWEYKKANGEKIVLRVVFERILKWMQKFEAVVDAAVSYDVSGHAAIPWTIIKMLLNTTLNSVEVTGDMVEGVEFVSKMIALYTEVELNSLRGVSRLKTQLGNALVSLYATILRYFAKAKVYFSQSTAKRITKGVFLSSDMVVKPLLDQVKSAEQDVIKIKDLVEAEDQKNRLIGLQSSVDKIMRDGLSTKLSEEDRRSQIKQWLNAVLTTENYQTAQSLRQGDTCNWILSCDEFQKWSAPLHADDAKARCLWIHGGPGFGKTVLAARIIDHLLKTQEASLVYFFCVSENEAKREPSAILRSWIAQLVQEDVQALNVVYKSYRDNSRSSPGLSDLWNLFSDLTKSKRYIFVVDGFDECTTINKASKFHTSDGRSQFMLKLFNECRNTQSLVLIVSRDKEDIRAPFNTAKKMSTMKFFEHGITTDDTRSDVSSFSMAMVKNALANKAQELQTEIAEEAAVRADGMFLWVHLLSQELDSGENAKALRRIVSEMPDGIDKAYERDLERLMEMKGEKKERAVAVLRWVLFAVRPLTVRELAEALILTNDNATSEYPLDELPDAWKTGYVDEDYVNTNIRRCCGSLVELRSHHANEPLAFHTIHFVHFSVKEYLLRSGDDCDGEPRFQSICFPNGATEHDRLARLCLQYLCYDVFGEKDQWKGKVKKRINVYPFLEYAAKSWHTHALKEHRMSEDILHYAEKLFNPSTSNWRIWSEVFENEEVSISDEEDGEADGNDYDHDNDDDINGAGVEEDDHEDADESDLEKDLFSDSDSDKDISVPNKNEEKISDDPMVAAVEEAMAPDTDSPSPIYYASLLGLTDIVKALQALGLSCDIKGGHYGSPLQAAVAYGNKETVEYLLGQGTDVRESGGVYGSAIGASVANGDEITTKILMDAGADLRSVDLNGRNLLHMACYNGDITIAKMLMNSDERDELVKETSKLEETPLLEAIESGSLEVVRLLIQAGADINAIDKNQHSALFLAILGKFDDIVKELVKKHVDVNYKTDKNVTALHIAAAIGVGKSVHYLLARKADIHAEDDDGWTPLLSAASAENEQVPIVKLFLDRGAVLDHTAHEGYTALQVASELGHTELVEFLIERGADVNSVNSFAESSLVGAVMYKRVETAKILLKHGADPYLTTMEGRTALDQAVKYEQNELIELLLSHGALRDISDSSSPPRDSVEAEDLRSLTRALQIEIFRGHEARAVELLKTHRHENIPGVLNSTLLAATLFGTEITVSTLLKLGASYKSKTVNNRTVLHTAAHRGCVPLMEAFLARGTNIHAKDICGSEALDIAIQGGYRNLDAVEFLLSRGALTELISGPTGDIVNHDEHGGAAESMHSLSETKRILQGKWSGHYTYASWCKDRKDKTSLTVAFVADKSGKPMTFAGDDADEVGDFKIRGHVLAGNVIRYVKLYKKSGWLYSGKLDAGDCKIKGSWGTNSRLWHGSVEMEKVEDNA